MVEFFLILGNLFCIVSLLAIFTDSTSQFLISVFFVLTGSVFLDFVFHPKETSLYIPKEYKEMPHIFALHSRTPFFPKRRRDAKKEKYRKGKSKHRNNFVFGNFGKNFVNQKNFKNFQNKINGGLHRSMPG